MQIKPGASHTMQWQQSKDCGSFAAVRLSLLPEGTDKIQFRASLTEGLCPNISGLRMVVEGEQAQASASRRPTWGEKLAVLVV
jgi:hypothetical protein